MFEKCGWFKLKCSWSSIRYEWGRSKVIWYSKIKSVQWREFYDTLVWNWRIFFFQKIHLMNHLKYLRNCYPKIVSLRIFKDMIYSRITSHIHQVYLLNLFLFSRMKMDMSMSESERERELGNWELNQKK